METRNEGFDPSRPFIGSDGLEYENFAKKLLGEPVDCWRNDYIIGARKNGRSEAAIREWIRAFDGDDPRPSTAWEAGARLNRANLAYSLAYAIERHDDFAPF